MPCSVILPVWQGMSSARGLVDRLAADAAIAEVVLVDTTGQTPPSWIQEYGGRVRGVASDARGNAAVARNAGAAAATGDTFVFCDSQLSLSDGALGRLLACAAREPACGVAAGKVLDAAGTVVRAGAVFGGERVPRPLYRGLPADHPAVNRSRAMQAVGGGPLLVTRTAFERAGGFDDAFARAYHDEDLCLRLGALGYTAVYCHECVASLDVEPTVGGPALSAEIAAFHDRWAATVRQDDLERYAQDGLLRLAYDASGQRRLRVSPLLAVVDDSAVAVEAGRILVERARRVLDLSRENAALAARGDTPAAAARTFSEAVAALLPGEDDGATGDLVPPYALRLSVGGRFLEDGEEYFGYFRDLAGLRPSDRVLDVGCGVGRMAVKLAPYLTGGSYEGFDVRADVIEWCQQHITPRWPHARFAFIDLANGLYNAAGEIDSTAFRFPYPPASFDFVLLTSVFTHLLPAAVERYTDEIVAALVPGGTCFCTYFLIDDESLRLMRAGLAGVFDFKHRGEGYRTLAPDAPEHALAYDESWVRGVYQARGLRIVEPIRYGRWSGRADGLSLQDIVIARKES